ncbi:hypothetical protein [Streptomyces sp. NBC_01445]|uniref:hypothetical protein n=1 Tax=Streptomyces sp. NBC_01445 TaxID=2903869 RepID=UPI002DDA7DE0|nr:hypothetical protein [Streptomyces sp. NBC_01445]WSE08903.1 hypothetical protein OG574_39365 [Streptomyces sp. NBC_01445]
MSHPAPTWTSVRRSERLADTPAVKRGAHWWLVSPSGSLLAADPAFTDELQRLATALADANRAVAEIHAQSQHARKAQP